MRSRAPYAEVIGDPIAQSKSPLIHKYWLKQLGIDGDYIQSHVSPGELQNHIRKRRSDPSWRGCNVTIPHKEKVLELLDTLDEDARRIGAVNCIVPHSGGFFGTNTDVEGIGVALGALALEGAKGVIVGAGGASRAAIAYLADRSVAELVILVRDRGKAESLRSLAPRARIEIVQLSEAQMAAADASVIINATQMGMTGCDPMPDELIEALVREGSSTTLFDMVYDPIDTSFLAAGREAGAKVVDGLTMLVGQAVKSFERFFGAAPPPADQSLRRLLLSIAAATAAA